MGTPELQILAWRRFSVSDEDVIGLSGTPAYMAPEQLLGGKTSVQSDIYSVGLVLFELFTGTRANQAEITCRASPMARTR